MAERRGGESPLIEAARRGDASSVERCLHQGASAGEADADGRTALHHAVAGRHVDAAATLLADAADPALRDRNGRAAPEPGAISIELLHAIRQRYHRVQRGAQRSTASPHAEAWRRELERRGIVKLPGFVHSDALSRMRGEFELFVRGLGRKVARGEAVKQHYFEEEHWWPAERAFISNNAFKHSPQLVRLTCQADILAAARLYLGRPPFVQRAVAMRYLAGTVAERDMFIWHHDVEDRRLKVMILLSDVAPGDQHLSYVCGSQRLFHPYAMFQANPCGVDYCRERLGELEIYDAVGNAGDVFLFDSNGAHRGNRRAGGRVRDVFLVELNASPANLWGGDVDARLLDELRPDPDLFARFLTAEKKWTAPNLDESSWIAALPILNSWRIASPPRRGMLT